MREIDVGDIFTSKGLAVVDIEGKPNLNDHYDLLLCSLIDGNFSLFVNVNHMTRETNFFDYVNYKEDRSTVFLYEREITFKYKPTKDDIIKVMI